MATLTIQNTTCILLPLDTEYGYLYNWWALIGDTTGDGSSNTNLINPTQTNWELPSSSDFETLMKSEYVDPAWTNFSNVAGDHLKESGTTYWGSPNTADNSTGFSARGSAYRNGEVGTFQGIGSTCRFWNSTTFNSTDANVSTLDYNTAMFFTSFVAFYHNFFEYGHPVRFVNNSTSLNHGETGMYIGNNSKAYPTICIGTHEWLSANIEETLYRDDLGNLTPIPYIDNIDAADDAEWVAATAGAYCIHA